MIEVLKVVDLRLGLPVMVAAVAHITDIVELRAGHHLFEIRKKDILMALRVTRITEKIAINNVFQFVVHFVPSSIYPSKNMLPLF